MCWTKAPCQNILLHMLVLLLLLCAWRAQNLLRQPRCSTLSCTALCHVGMLA